MVSQAPASRSLYVSTRELRQVSTASLSDDLFGAPRGDSGLAQLQVNINQTPQEEDGVDLEASRLNVIGNQLLCDLYKPAVFEGVLGTVSGIDVPREGVSVLKVEDLHMDNTTASFDYIELTNTNAGFDVDFEYVTNGNTYTVTYEIKGFMGAFGGLPPIDYTQPVTITNDDWSADVNVNNILLRINLFLQSQRLKPKSINVPPVVSGSDAAAILDDCLNNLRRLRFQVLTNPNATASPLCIYMNTADTMYTYAPNRTRLPWVGNIHRRMYVSFARFRTFGKYMVSNPTQRYGLDIESAAQRTTQGEGTTGWEFRALSYRDSISDMIQPYSRNVRDTVLRVVLRTDASSSNQDFTAKSRFDDTQKADWGDTIGLLFLQDDGTCQVRATPHTLAPGSRLSSFKIALVNEYGDLVYTQNHFNVFMSITSTSNLRNPYV